METENIGKCRSCPSSSFSMHSFATSNVQEGLQWKVNRIKKEHKCTFRDSSLVFKTYHQLKKHKPNTNHFVRKRKCHKIINRKTKHHLKESSKQSQIISNLTLYHPRSYHQMMNHQQQRSRRRMNNCINPRRRFLNSVRAMRV